ncbi:GDP-mannose 4,6-dehydratase [Shewanella sp.]|uniref:GDP-mannose 4,6-dehydratase n=1 Tax=Shewanella sp. TaxID=50422 RepID=UPI00404848EA
MKRALICGISGQDGAYLAQLLLKKGYEVYGTTRDAQITSFLGLTLLGIKDDIKYESVSLNDLPSVFKLLIRLKPDEIYNLAGQSSVALSFQQPVETMESITIGSLNLMEAIRLVDRPIKLYNAGSSECFGEVGDLPANESTPFHPLSPYAVAKAGAFWLTANYREAYNLFACTGVLFNHESPLRPERFVTQKIVTGACRIFAGMQDSLNLGNLTIQRDWGWAPEYVEAMWLMLQQNRPADFVIATGHTFSLEQFAEHAFSAVGLDWRNHVLIDAAMARPTDILVGKADPSKAKQLLDWEAKSRMPDVVRQMVEACLKKPLS